jgi:hypothetical protein
MKKIAIILYFAINSSFIFAQISLTIENSSVNNTISGSWGGVNITRNQPTTFTYRNNSITSINSEGYLLQAGDEAPGSTNNNLDGEVIVGNKFVWNGTNIASTITHALFVGYNKDYSIKYNYLFRCPTAIVLKSNGMTNTSGGVAYNIINKTGSIGIAVKGMNGCLIYDNTFYSNEVEWTSNSQPGTLYGLVDIFVNDARNAYSTGTKIKNNIFYTVNQIYNITIEDTQDLVGFESDYNIFWCESGTPMFNYLGTAKTFAEWQALGYDSHSKVINPNFNNFTDFVPATRLDYGTDLGSAWQTGLSTSAVWTIGYAPKTTNQNGTWQVGARIYDAIITNPVYLSSVVENAAPNILEMNYSLNLANIVPPATAFNVVVNSATRTVNSVTVTGNKVLLTLGSDVKFGDIITVSYTKPSTNPLQTDAGGTAISISPQTVINKLIAPIIIITPVNITMTISPVYVHKILNVKLSYSGIPSTAISPEIIRISDLSGKVFIEKLLVTGITALKIPINLKSGIYNVIIFGAGIEMASQRIQVY